MNRLFWLGALLVWSGCSPLAGEAARLSREAYVWQRNWDDGVCEAVRRHGPEFDRLVVLGAEISFKEGQPRIGRASVNYAALTAARTRVGLALRIGPFRGSFETNAPPAKQVVSAARALVAESRAHGVEPSELQIDFDCAESKLDGYRQWVEAVRAAVAPARVTITALPSWLHRAEFKALAAAASPYVLQVHSLDRPASADAKFNLCDPKKATEAVSQAARLGIPFRVALPTYGYYVAFEAAGRFVGLSAEGTLKSWPAGVRVREVRSDPLEQAGLVRLWTTNPPPVLRGLTWYRLPCVGDILNWRWPTLSAIMAARYPQEKSHAETRRVEPGLFEINLVNNGDLDISSRLVLEARWPRERAARLTAGDGLGGFEMSAADPATVIFQPRANLVRLPAGETLPVGWVRLDKDCEVLIELRRERSSGSAGPLP